MDIPLEKNALISAGMKIRNKKKFRYGISAYTGPIRALFIRIKVAERARSNFAQSPPLCYGGTEYHAELSGPICNSLNSCRYHMEHGK
jgi:hypothetical protein